MASVSKTVEDINTKFLQQVDKALELMCAKFGEDPWAGRGPKS